MKEVKASQYKVTDEVTLSRKQTLTNLDSNDDDLKGYLRKIRRKLGKKQDTMYAHDKFSVLVCMQGMDTSGKDSLIGEVFKDFNVAGVEVTSFKTPTDLERSHDYLWRHQLALPQRGRFGVWNRTHYENVLVTRVHPEYILGETIPGVNKVEDVNERFWDSRFDQINNFEKHLADNGTLVFKFFMHLSKEEQRNRLLRRLDLPEKNWKFSGGDIKERRLWDQYQDCYQDAINRTSKEHAPWFVIPADNKKAARVIVASILLEEISKHKEIKEPELDDKTKANLDSYRKELNNE